MLLSNILRSGSGACPFFNKKAGILSRKHFQPRRTCDSGFQEIVTLAADAAKPHAFEHSGAIRYP